MAVRKLNGRYVVEFEQKGNRVFRRFPPGATKAQAEAFQLHRRRELIDQGILGRAPTVPLSVAIAEWVEEVVEGRKSAKETKSKASIVSATAGHLGLTKEGISEAAALLQAAKRKNGGPLAAATVNRRLAILKGTAKWAWKVKHWTPENLSPYVIMIDKKKERVRDVSVSQSVVERVIRKGRNFEARAFIALGAYGLMRTGEIMRAKPKDIGRGLKLPETKTGVPRVVPILPQLRPFLKAIPFRHHKRTLYGWFEEARDAAGVREDLVHHDLRRSGATILLNAGVSLEVVAHILGDSLEVAKKHYAHILNRTAEKAMRKGFSPIKNPSAKSRIGVSA